MKTSDDYLQEGIVSDVTTNLKNWFGSDDFKKRIEKELGIKWEDVEAKLKERVKNDPAAIEKAVGMTFDKMLGK